MLDAVAESDSQLAPLILTRGIGWFPNAKEVLGLPSLLPSPNKDARNIAVLGGGITGLCTAFNLAQSLPHANITIYEKSLRLGGWMDTEVVDVKDGQVFFEWGPRTLRPDPDGAGHATLQLIAKLGLLQEVLWVPKTHPASQNRFLYYPDRLVRMPSPYSSGILRILDAIKNILIEPIFSGLITSILREPTKPIRPEGTFDESVGSFLKRRFGPAAADNLASALFHGIYAGDIYSLSARTCLPKLWYLEKRDPEGNGIQMELLDLAFKGQTLLSGNNFRLQALNPAKKYVGLNEALLAFFGLFEYAGRASALSMKQGLGTITMALEKVVATLPNVSISTASKIRGLEYDNTTRCVAVRSGDYPAPRHYDYVVSSLRPGIMRDLITTGLSSKDPTSAANRSSYDKVDKAVTVMVVNLHYPNPNLLPPDKLGFGYLIPRSVEMDQNPERALGVVFASSISPQARMVKRSEYRKAMIHRMRASDKVQQEVVANMHKVTESTPSGTSPAVQTCGEILLLDEIREYHENLDKDREAKLQEYLNDKGEADSALIKIDGQDTAPGTKLGVMLGGHWWDGWSETDYPSEEEAIKMAKSVLQRHLGITDEPAVAKARLQRDCIPQYPVGYRNVMAEIHRDLIDQFKGKLKVAGPWWQGAVGVNDCVRKAREVSLALENRWDDQTGLEEYTRPELWLLEDNQTGKVEVDPMSR